MASVAAWLPFARAAAIGWAPLARKFFLTDNDNNDIKIKFIKKKINRKSASSASSQTYSEKSRRKIIN